MGNETVLSKVMLAYSPMTRSDRSISSTRLNVLPLRAQGSLNAEKLLGAVDDSFAEPGPSVCLSASSEALVHDMLRLGIPSNVMLEVPNFMAADVSEESALSAQYRNGSVLLMGGQPNEMLGEERLQCFRHVILDFWSDRQIGGGTGPAPASKPRRFSVIHSGIRSRVEMRASFASGSYAVVGWPIDARSTSTGLAPLQPLAPETDVMIVAELIRQVKRGDELVTLENTLKRDPALAFKLLRHMNSAVFALPVQISSFRHAIMLLGYKHLGRWLALLLATASQDPNMRPIMFASVRRGLLMEELFGGEDQEARDEVFMCGVFSMLDLVFLEDMDTLLQNIPVPERIARALVHGDGPFAPCLAMARATETASIGPFTEAADGLLSGIAEVNVATLRTLKRANLLE